LRNASYRNGNPLESLLVLSRDASRTGSAIAKACGIEAQSIDELNDIDYGSWRMKSHDEMAAAEPTLYATWFNIPHLMRFPGGDSLQDLVSRSADAVRLALELHPDGTVVLVSHDSVNRALLLQLADLPLGSYWRLVQTPCCINETLLDLSETFGRQNGKPARSSFAVRFR
jgi:phosphoserine phosphatase